MLSKFPKLRQYMSGDVTDTSNYRPIATLSPFTKVLERLIYDQLYAFLEKFDVLYKYRFGFKKELLN